jgi:hypothetical protein
MIGHKRAEGRIGLSARLEGQVLADRRHLDVT